MKMHFYDKILSKYTLNCTNKNGLLIEHYSEVLKNKSIAIISLFLNILQLVEIKFYHNILQNAQFKKLSYRARLQTPPPIKLLATIFIFENKCL